MRKKENRDFRLRGNDRLRRNDGPEDGAKESITKKLVIVGLPIAAQSFITGSLNFVDNLIVGRVGEDALAAVGLASQVFFIFWMVLFGFTGGTITYMSQFFGAKDIKSIKRVIGISEAVCISVGIIFFVGTFFFPEKVLSVFTDIPEIIALGTPFIRLGSFICLAWSIVVPLTAGLRATQQTRIPFKISIAVFSTNTALGICLVYGFLGFPKFGAIGVYYSLLIARALELTLYLIAVFGRKNLISGKLSEYTSFSKDLFKRVVKNAVPTTLNETLWGAGFAAYNAAYGRIGVTAFAAAQAGTTIINILALACFAVGDATLILVGEKLGEGRREDALLYAKKLLKIAVILGIIAGVILLIISKPIISLFDFSPLGESYTFKIMMIRGAILGLALFNVTMITGILRAGGDTLFAMFSEVGTVWLIGVPLAFITALYFSFPVYVVVLFVQIEEVVKFFILFQRFRSRKWMRTLV